MARQKLGARLPQVRVTPELKEALEAKARKQNIRLLDAIRQALVKYVENGEVQPAIAGEVKR